MVARIAFLVLQRFIQGTPRLSAYDATGTAKEGCEEEEGFPRRNSEEFDSLLPLLIHTIHF
jgi:hypothetical protein